MSVCIRFSFPGSKYLFSFFLVVLLFTMARGCGASYHDSPYIPLPQVKIEEDECAELQTLLHVGIQEVFQDVCA